MKDFNIINLNQLTWALNVAIMGLVFSIFSLIYNNHYIYYGLITVGFGVIVHMFVNFFDWFFRINENHKYIDERKYWIAHLTYFLLFIMWICFLVL